MSFLSSFSVSLARGFFSIKLFKEPPSIKYPPTIFSSTCNQYKNPSAPYSTFFSSHSLRTPVYVPHRHHTSTPCQVHMPTCATCGDYRGQHSSRLSAALPTPRSEPVTPSTTVSDRPPLRSLPLAWAQLLVACSVVMVTPCLLRCHQSP